MIDCHNHILPGLDDGAQDIETSLAMLEQAERSGTDAVVNTPHVIEGDWMPEWPLIVEKCCLLKDRARAAGLNIEIYPGAEVALHMDILNMIEGPGPYCVNGGRYMLVELPATEIPRYAEDFFFSLQAKGITPVLAHPERHPEIIRDPSILVSWVNKGILMQLNTPSVMGRMGEKAMKTAEILLLSNLIHCLGSDAHGAKSRRPVISDAAAKIAGLIGAKAARRLTLLNPLKIINSEDVEIEEVSGIYSPQKRGLLQSLFSFFG